MYMIEIKRKGIKREDRKLGVPKTERRTKTCSIVIRNNFLPNFWDSVQYYDGAFIMDFS